MVFRRLLYPLQTIAGNRQFQCFCLMALFGGIRKVPFHPKVLAPLTQHPMSVRPTNVPSYILNFVEVRRICSRDRNLFFSPVLCLAACPLVFLSYQCTVTNNFLSPFHTNTKNKDGKVFTFSLTVFYNI